MSQVCKDVGWDGQGFYCLRCGKAGFRSEASARGHLSQCKGRAIERGVPVVGMENLPAPVETFQRLPVEQVVLPPVGAGAGGGTYHPFSGGGGGGGQTTTLQSEAVVDYSGWYPGVDQRLKALENEYNHMVMSTNQPGAVGDWFSHNKGIIIIGAIVLFAVIMMNQNRQCPSVSGSGGMKAIGNVGEKALMKLMDRGISKGVDSLFK